MSEEYRLGHADVRLEPDLIFVRLHGGMTPAQVPQALGLMTQLQGQSGSLFVLVDMREGERLSPDMRRLFSHLLADYSPAAMGVFGASLEQRGSHALLMGAVAGVSGRRVNVSYFQTEAEARLWLAAERKRLSS